MSTELILASASPRRRELLDQIKVSYSVMPVDIDETPRVNEEARVYVQRIAAEKSLNCLELHEIDRPVLAADTTVVIHGRILGKPESLESARDMLVRLSGQTHQVYTAVSIRLSSGIHEKRHLQTMSRSDVRFRKLSDDEIEAYCQTGEPMGKAGSYAIQGLASIFVEQLVGSYSGVVGLPLYETASLLSNLGIEVLYE